MEKIFASLANRFNPDSITAVVVSYTPNVVSAFLTFIIFWFLWKLLANGLNFFIKKTSLDKTLSGFFQDVLKYLIVGAGLLSALSELGINTASLLASLGVAGLTIGFAAKDTLSNLISGLFIFWDRPFAIGDIVEIGSDYGRVSDITLRSTRVVTPDGKMIALPNSKVIASVVTSYTNFPHLRIATTYSFPATVNRAKIRENFTKLVSKDPSFLKNPEPQVLVETADTTKVTLKFLVWIQDEKQHQILEHQLRESVYDTFVEQMKN